MTLLVSITIRKGLSQSGAPSGRRCAIDAFRSFVNVEKINDSHIGKPKVRVIMRWLVTLKVYGFRPIMFAIISVGKIVEIMEVDPFNLFVYVRDSCIKIKVYIISDIVLIRDGITQNVSCMIEIMINLEISNRFVEGLTDEKEAGSNDEKISIIIKTWIWAF